MEAPAFFKRGDTYYALLGGCSCMGTFTTHYTHYTQYTYKWRIIWIGTCFAIDPSTFVAGGSNRNTPRIQHKEV